MDIYETFGDNFVCVEAVPERGKTNDMYDVSKDLKRLKQTVDAIQQKVEDKRSRISSLVRKIGREKRRVLVWGAGAKGVSYMNMLNIHDEIQYIVDINPNKHGKYIAGTGQKIVPPEFAKDYHPDTVIVMNPIYTEEIKHALSEMDIHPEFLHV